MNRLLGIVAFALISFSTLSAQNEDEIKGKIDALKTQIGELEGKISEYEGMLPKPVEPNWKYKGNVAINLGQALLGDWAAGGNSNINLNGLTHLEANYKKGKHEWNNGFDGSLGFIKNWDAVSGNDMPINKNVDMLQLSSKYLYDLQKANLKVGIGANFLTQFFKTYDVANPEFLLSDFLAPGFLDVSPGLEWTPKDFLKVFFSPASGRFTFVNNDVIINRAEGNRFGNDLGSKVRSELGARADIVFDKEVLPKFVVRSRIQLFNNYTRPQDQLDAIYSSRANIDVNWQTDLFYKLSENFAFNFGFQTIKDDDVRFENVDNPDPDGQLSVWQLRQSFGVGFVYGL